MSKPPKLFVAITSPISTVLLTGQLNFMQVKGYDVALLAPNDTRVTQLCQSEGVRHVPVNFSRKPRPWNDLMTFFSLVRILITEKPDIVNAGTPKASLITLMASRLTGVKHKIYTCRGLRYESEVGFKRVALKLMESLLSKLSDRVVCVGFGLQKKAIGDRVFASSKCLVLGKGSSNGINLEHYKKQRAVLEDCSKIRTQLGIDNKTFVIGFVGRLITRKGVNELVYAFESIHSRYSNTLMILVGGMDESQQPEKQALDILKNHSNIVNVNWVEDVRPYYAMFDLFVLPSYWEGFANVLLQAAAMELPIVTTNGTGCSDAVKEGFNSLVVKQRDENMLRDAIVKLMSDESMRENFAQNSRKWAKNFESQHIWNGQQELYKSMLSI